MRLETPASVRRPPSQAVQCAVCRLIWMGPASRWTADGWEGSDAPVLLPPLRIHLDFHLSSTLTTSIPGRPPHSRRSLSSARDSTCYEVCSYSTADVFCCRRCAADTRGSNASPVLDNQPAGQPNPQAEDSSREGGTGGWDGCVGWYLCVGLGWADGDAAGMRADFDRAAANADDAAPIAIYSRPQWPPCVRRRVTAARTELERQLDGRPTGVSPLAPTPPARSPPPPRPTGRRRPATAASAAVCIGGSVRITSRPPSLGVPVVLLRVCVLFPARPLRPRFFLLLLSFPSTSAASRVSDPSPANLCAKRSWRGE